MSFIIFEDNFSIRYNPDQFKTQQMHDDDCLAALKFVPDWFVTSEIIKNPPTALYADKNIFCFNVHSADAVFYCNETGIIGTDLDNINITFGVAY